jgi:Tol biopolymer transport system component
MDGNQNSGGAAKSQVLDELARILNSAEFEHSDRSRPLLQFLVESATAGRESDLKESLIGVRVFERDASYNPKVDPVVRVTMGRLRAKLEKYYLREGLTDTVRIAIPKGSYVPVFEHAAGKPPVEVAPPVPVPAPRNRRGLPLAAAALILVLASVAFWAVRRPHPPALDHLRLFDSSGTPYHPSFSPAGNMLAFDAQGAGDRHRTIYLQRLDATSPTRVGDDTLGESCPVWSPDGNQLAFLREFSPEVFDVLVMPVVGGAPRKVAELRRGASNWLAWSPDGRWLAGAEPTAVDKPGIVLISPVNGEKRVLTKSPAGWHGDSLPEFSADSGTIAFRRTGPLSGHEDIYTVPVAGGPIRRLTFDDRGISGLALLRDGSLLVTSKRVGSIRSLWWQSAPGGNLERLTPATMDAGTISVSRDGAHFALVPYISDVNVWSVKADGTGEPHPLIDSELADSSPQYSSDGRRLAFHTVRTGTASLWVSDATGANALQLVDGKGFEIGNEQWSPDGSQMVFEWHISGRSALYVVSSDGGTPRPLLVDGFNNDSPVWSTDGASVYFTSDRSGQNRIWRVSARGGDPVAMVRTPSVTARFARDGGALYYLNVVPGMPVRDLYRQRLHDGELAGDPEPVVSGLDPADWANWMPVRDGVYYLRRQRGQPTEIQYLDFATHAVRTIWQMQKSAPTGGGLTVSPDGLTVLFTQTDREGSAIYVQ